MTTRSRTKTENSKKPSSGRRKSSEGTKTAADATAPVSRFGKSLLKRILDESHRTKTLPKGSGIVVAISGGPDSTALLRILVGLSKKLSFRLSGAHVNYRLRGKDSDRDERSVTRFCKRYSVPISILRPEDMTGKNEEALRDIRYDFFEDERKRLGYDLIATGHTGDDQAETVLLRLFRGSGPSGLSGMRPVNGRIVRPLLGTAKSELVRFLREEHIPFRTDKSNLGTDIPRNRIRNRLIPLLESEYQPNIRKILARTADTACGYRGSRYTDFPISLPGGISFSRKDFLALPDETQSDVLRELFRMVSGTGKNPDAAFVREAKKLIGSEKGKAGRFRSGLLKIEARGDTVAMIRT